MHIISTPCMYIYIYIYIILYISDILQFTQKAGDKKAKLHALEKVQKTFESRKN
jgi:hypothetical protein